MITRALTSIAVVAVAVGAATGVASAQTPPPPPPAPPPGDFVNEVTNPYMPLDPGTTFHYRGTKEGQPAADNFTVTHQTKRILGVRTTVVKDVALVNGQAEEKTFDWFAQDRRGTVWYFGEDSFDKVNGQWVRNEGSWKAGVDGAKPGIAMEASPKVGDFYRQEFAPGHAEDVARVLTTGRVLVTRDWSLIDPSSVERKTFVRGIGQVHTVAVQGPQEESHLVSITDDD
jgi:hypothetical protein